MKELLYVGFFGCVGVWWVGVWWDVGFKSSKMQGKVQIFISQIWFFLFLWEVIVKLFFFFQVCWGRKKG